MTATTPGRLAISCGLFLASLLIFTSFDLALTLAITTYLILTKARPLSLFVAASVALVAGIIFDYFDIYFPLVSDLSIDAYILFVAGVILYLKSRKDFLSLVKKLGRKEKKIFSRYTFLSLLASLMTFLLFFPLLGGFFAAALGYFLFSYLNKQFNGKLAISIALLLLITATGFLLIDNSSLAEELGNYSYFFLVIGTIQEIIKFVRYRNASGTIKKVSLKRSVANIPAEEKIREKESIATVFTRQEKALMNMAAQEPTEVNLVKTTFFLVLAITVLIIILAFSSFGITRLPNLKLGLLTKKITPSPTIVTPTLMPISSEDLKKLKIFIQNGTNIRGLAASTAAKLKESGFTEIDIGNAARRDYLEWEIAMREYREELVSLIKKTLKLTELKPSEASIPAKFDILIIAGRKK